ncbi:MAG: transketolase, partial [Firmicutes bacterium]|nr:transketolase [Bacillota bacterium]
MPAFTSEQLAVSALRALSIDAVEAAGSGHPGLPMGAAPMAYALWAHHLTHNPKNPEWFNRDRFVLSAGHGSALLYSLLHMAGFNVTKDDLREFRKLGSRTPGHPERGHTPGVETTTGPLGQGFANAVGMAMAERFLAATFNRDGFPVVDHRTFALVGDGDLMEGVSYEAASLAGHLRLGRLIVLYDSNHICLDGPIANTFTEDVQARFTALGWRTLRVTDGNDVGAIRRALEDACRRQDRPTLIEVRTTIGFGSPARQGTSEAHGKPLGPEQARLAKLSYGWPETPPFHVPPLAYDAFAPAATRGAQAEAKWHETVNHYRRAHPELGQAFMRALAGDLPSHLGQVLPAYADGASLATREASGAAINAIAEHWPTFIGGSADLSSSNNTTITSSRIFSEADPA